MVTRYYDNLARVWVNTVKMSYQHDARGRLISDTTSNWNRATSQWEPNVLRVFGYSAGSSRPTQVSFFDWNGASYDPASRLLVTYTATDQFSTISGEQWYGNGYALNNRDSFAYDATDAIVYHISQAKYNSLLTVLEETRRLNAAHLPDSVTMLQLTDPVGMSYETRYMCLTWNSFGNPVTQSTRLAGKPAPGQLQRYYYTGFGAGQSVSSAPVFRDLIIFPNPAEWQVSIRPDFSGRYTLSLVNAAGRMVKSSTGNASAGQSIILPLEDLAPGLYRLQLQNAAGEQYGTNLIRK